MRLGIGLPVADTPSPWAGSANECLAKGIALHDEYRDDPLVTTALAPDLDSCADETLVRVETATMVVQVNGKVRDRVEVSAGITEDDMVQQARMLAKVAPLLEGATMIPPCAAMSS